MRTVEVAASGLGWGHIWTGEDGDCVRGWLPGPQEVGTSQESLGGDVSFTSGSALISGPRSPLLIDCFRDGLLISGIAFQHILPAPAVLGAS